MTTEARFIHCTFLKVRSVLKQTSLIPGDTTLSWQQGETLSNTIYFWFLWRFIYSNSHPKFLSFLEFLSEKWWLLLFFVKLTLLNEMKWSIWSYSVSNLQPLNLSDIPTCVFQRMLCMYALTMEDLYNYLLKSNLRLQYLSRSMQITVMLSVLLFVSCTISLRQIFTNLHIHSDTWF